MDNMLRSVREYVENGEYFTEARKWYKMKYITPLSYRSMSWCATALFIFLVLVLVININNLLPLERRLQYAIDVDGAIEKNARIIKADGINNTPLHSVLDVILRDYVKAREQYDYDNIANQLDYVKNTSTRIVFKQYYNYLSIDNADSPVLRYQRDARRTIKVTDVKFIDDNTATINFTSEGKDMTGAIFENMSWTALVDFESDKINLDLGTGAPFNFVVTEYKLKLIGDRNAKN
jgi:type IV secretion system protein VirB8